MDIREKEVHETMAAINRAWRENRPSEMQPHLHPEITMVLPGFNGAIAGGEKLIAGFDEFCSNAKVLEYSESEEQIQIIGDVAVLSFRFNMLYERPAYRARSTGRDLWAFKQVEGKWLAVWRTMLELQEERSGREADTPQ